MPADRAYKNRLLILPNFDFKELTDNVYVIHTYCHNKINKCLLCSVSWNSHVTLLVIKYSDSKFSSFANNYYEAKNYPWNKRNLMAAISLGQAYMQASEECQWKEDVSCTIIKEA